MSVNDTDLNLDEKQGRNHWHDVKPKVEIIHRVIGWADENKQRDRLYCLVKTEEKEVFAIERPSGGLEVRLRAGDPASGHEKIPDGVFHGTLVRCDFEAGRDYLCLDATVPEAQIEELRRALKSNPALELEVTAHILSLSYEVDDALREWHHPRGLIVRKMTSAPIHCISFSHSSSGNATFVTDTETGPEDEEKTDNSGQPSTPDDIGHLMHKISTQMANVSRSASRLMIAAWVGIGIFVLFNL